MIVHLAPGAPGVGIWGAFHKTVGDRDKSKGLRYGLVRLCPGDVSFSMEYSVWQCTVVVVFVFVNHSLISLARLFPFHFSSHLLSLPWKWPNMYLFD